MFGKIKGIFNKLGIITDFIWGILALGTAFLYFFDGEFGTGFLFLIVGIVLTYFYGIKRWKKRSRVDTVKPKVAQITQPKVSKPKAGKEKLVSVKLNTKKLRSLTEGVFSKFKASTAEVKEGVDKVDTSKLKKLNLNTIIKVLVIIVLVLVVFSFISNLFKGSSKKKSKSSSSRSYSSDYDEDSGDDEWDWGWGEEEEEPSPSPKKSPKPSPRRSPKPSPKKTVSENEEIYRVARAYVEKHSAPGLGFDLKIIKKLDKYVLLEAIPLHGETDNAGVILEKINGRWVAQTMGTYFEDWYNRVPELFN